MKMKGGCWVVGHRQSDPGTSSVLAEDFCGPHRRNSYGHPPTPALDTEFITL
jgi:hypothetical protein